MTEQNQPNSTESERPQTGEAWKDVGNQFQSLGESIARALRTAWDGVENKQEVQEMRRGLESMVNDIGKAIQETSSSPQGQQVRTEARKAAESLRSAGEQTYREAQPHLVSALRQIDESLRRAINNIENQRTTEGTTPPAGETETKPGSGPDSFNI